MELEKLIFNFRKLGLKVTPQRAVIYRTLREGGHMTAEMIFYKVKEILPPIGKATVYATLNELVEAGIISRLILQDNVRYFDITPTPHSHFWCNYCHRIWDINEDVCPYPEQLREIAKKICRVNIVFYGICKNCAKEKEVKNGEANSTLG